MGHQIETEIERAIRKPAQNAGNEASDENCYHDGNRHGNNCNDHRKSVHDLDSPFVTLCFAVNVN